VAIEGIGGTRRPQPGGHGTRREFTVAARRRTWYKKRAAAMRGGRIITIVPEETS